MTPVYVVSYTTDRLLIDDQSSTTESDPVTEPVRDVVEHWVAAFNAHQPDKLRELFTRDALFQGFGPEVIVGQAAVRAYFAVVPDIRTAEDVAILHTFTIGSDVAGGFVAVTFRDPGGWEAPVHLSLVLHRAGGQWLIHQYHASRVSDEH
jgi:uncharacterized protein (TIGR02246 family)